MWTPTTDSGSSSAAARVAGASFLAAHGVLTSYPALRTSPLALAPGAAAAALGNAAMPEPEGISRAEAAGVAQRGRP